MGKLEKAIKIHMLLGLLCIITPFMSFLLYPPLNIVYWAWYFSGLPWEVRYPIWFYIYNFYYVVIIATECLEWYALRVLKKRKRTEKARGSEVVE